MLTTVRRSPLQLQSSSLEKGVSASLRLYQNLIVTTMTPNALTFFSGDVPKWSWVRFPLLYFYEIFFSSVFLHFFNYFTVPTSAYFFRVCGSTLRAYRNSTYCMYSSKYTVATVLYCKGVQRFLTSRRRTKKSPDAFFDVFCRKASLQ